MNFSISSPNSALNDLEEEAVFVMREVAGSFEKPALLFSGGKDSCVLLRLAEKAFGQGCFPFPLLMIDTGHNFPEVIQFRDQTAQTLKANLIIRFVEDSIKRGTVRLSHPLESRNPHQSVTLLEAIEEFAHQREVIPRKGLLVPVTEVTQPKQNEKILIKIVRFRTVGDMTCTCPIESNAKTAKDIVKETTTVTISERGATRMDDQTSEASMEKRKLEGYF